jgi:hypothetical protein
MAMGEPNIRYVDGRAFSGRRFCELRRQQIGDWAKLKRGDPRFERTAAGRSAELSGRQVRRQFAGGRNLSAVNFAELRADHK